MTTIYVIDLPYTSYRPAARATDEPGCTHIALALAVVIFTICTGLLAHQMGAPAVAYHGVVLLSAIYAIFQIIVCEARLWFSPGVARV